MSALNSKQTVLKATEVIDMVKKEGDEKSPVKSETQDENLKIARGRLMALANEAKAKNLF